MLSDPQGKRKARDYATARHAEGTLARSTTPMERWETWVEPWLREAYRRRTRTLDRYLGAWKFLRHFLAEQKVPLPRLLSYAHVLAFVEWRQQQEKRSGRRPSRNTALLDVRVLSQVMREAIRRGFASINHAANIGLSRDDSREKPEILDDELATIRAALTAPERPAWMRIAFEVALHQGCRLRETAVDFRDIDLARDMITFRAKGGKVFGTRLHPGLKPLLVQMKADGALRTCTLPALPSKHWWEFFRKVGLSHLCFHCTRVTCVTRMARAGVPIQQAMAYVGHASELIHRVYQRLKPQDLSACVAALQFAPTPAPGVAAGQGLGPAAPAAPVS